MAKKKKQLIIEQHEPFDRIVISGGVSASHRDREGVFIEEFKTPFGPMCRVILDGDDWDISVMAQCVKAVK